MVGPSANRVGGAAAAVEDIATSNTAIAHTVPVRSLFSGGVDGIMGTGVLNALGGCRRYCSLGFSLLLFGGAVPGGGVPPGSDDAGAVSPSKSLVAPAATWAM